jgi:hypothetical protein
VKSNVGRLGYYDSNWDLRELDFICSERRKIYKVLTFTEKDLVAIQEKICHLESEARQIDIREALKKEKEIRAKELSKIYYEVLEKGFCEVECEIYNWRW